MKGMFKWIAITIGLVLISIIGLVVMVNIMSRHPKGTVLKVAIKGDIPEESTPGMFGNLFGDDESTVRDYIEAILEARDDERVTGMLVSLDRSSIGFATAQEFRDAIAEFRTSGKWTVAYLETAGEFSSGNKMYYIATACESIWLAPPGDINLVGVRFEVPFLRGTLDKLGIVPDFDHIGRYKNAKNFYTDRSMTPAHRESIETIADTIFGQLVSGIAAGRGLTEERVIEIIDGGPYTAGRAMEAGLIDEMGYRDEVEDHLRERNDGELPLVSVGDYLEDGRYYDGRVKIALVYGVGPLTRGSSNHNPVTGADTMGSDTIAAAIREAREDESIKAIVFRVDSPGGSYVSSDIILRELKLAQEAKPVIVSMVDYAASGGYFVSLGADTIIAQPGTLTGSIGVLAGKFITTGFWDKVGLTSDAVQRGNHASFYSSELPYTPGERAIFKGLLDRIYEDFVGKVADARGKTFEEVDAIAQGRVWLGEKAIEIGLVDELGGLTLAVERALERVEAGPEEQARLVILPHRKSWIEDLISGGGDTRAAIRAMRADLIQLIEEGPVPQRHGVLEMPMVPGID